MRRIAAVLPFLMLSALCAFAVRAGDAETIADIDKAAAALNAAFEKDDVGAIKALTTPDHIAVTPYYDGPQSLDDQAASLPDLEHSHTKVSGVSVMLLGPDTALRSYTAELKGSFKGRTHPKRAFISAIWVKQNGAWVEKFYQVTALRHGHGQRGACRTLAGTYLTKNLAKGASGDSVISRSIVSLDRSGIFLFTDSGEGGEAGFAPFTDGSGTWQCVSGEGGTLKARATSLDFTEPTAEQPKAAIGRLDFEFSLNPENEAMTGTATLYLVPLDADPLDEAALKDGREFEITTERIEAP